MYKYRQNAYVLKILTTSAGYATQRWAGALKEDQKPLMVRA
jgi:hypothetical protein